MKVRTDLGMVFQEGALFDSLTVAENVGYKLYEESDMPLDEVRRRVEEVLGFVGLSEHIDKMPSELSGGQRRRVAIARAMSLQAAHPALRRADDRARPDHRRYHRRRDHQAARHRERELDRRHASAARCLPHCHLRGRSRGRRQLRIVPADEKKAEEAEFIMLRDGRIHFEGHAAELRAVAGPVSQGVSFVEVGHAPHAIARLVGTEDRHPRRRRPSPLPAF